MIANEATKEYCKNLPPLSKTKKQMEEYLKKHSTVDSFHHYNSGDEFAACGWFYYGKLRLNGTIWVFE